MDINTNQRAFSTRHPPLRYPLMKLTAATAASMTVGVLLAGCSSPAATAPVPQVTVTETATATATTTPAATPTAAPAPPAPETSTQTVTQVTQVIERTVGAAPGSFGSPSRWCGGAVGVNDTTSCPFAENVASAVWRRGRSSTFSVRAYSSVTKKTYNMTCYGSIAPSVCVGGKNAKVWVY